MIDILDSIHLTIAQELEDFIDDLKGTIETQRQEIGTLNYAVAELRRNAPRHHKPPKHSMYPLNDMKIGDTIFIGHSKQNVISALACRYRPRRFSTKTVKEGGISGVRVWRIEDFPTLQDTV